MNAEQTLRFRAAVLLAAIASKSIGKASTAAMTSPTGFEVMVAEQNRWPEMQRLLGGSYLTIAFRQVGAQRLIGDVSMSVFFTNSTGKIPKRHRVKTLLNF